MARERPSEATYARKFSEPCYFGPFGLGIAIGCDGPADLAHLIPAQRLRAAGAPVWDDRVVVVACRKHHVAFDGFYLRLRQDQLPPELWSYARENGLEYAIDRDYQEAA